MSREHGEIRGVHAEDEIMRYLPTRRVVTAVLAAAGMGGSFTLAMGQTQGPPPPSDSQLVPSAKSSPPDIKPKSRPAIPQDTAGPVQPPASPQPK
jgi:hypothetical protein